MQTGEWIGGARILGTAGRGAMGVVYQAHQATLDRVVAVKVVASELASDPEFRARFHREARAAGALSHPHIVAVYDAGEDHGRLYLTMQYIEGRDLASMLRQHGPMPPRDAVAVVAQIASALDAAHERRLVHRDVKPANIMVTRRDAGWHAYLTDFGITTHLGEAGLTRTGLAVGTLDFMAPEQLVGDPYDHRADVYALGAVLHQALTGQVPFPRETDAARIYAHLNDDVPDVATRLSEQVPAQVRSGLSAVVRRALAKQPGTRFGSAGELAEAARAALDGEAPTRGPRSKPYTPVSQIHGAGRSRPGRRALLLGGVGVVALGTGAAVAATRLGADGEPAPTDSPSAELGLPDDVPAATPDARVTRTFDVGANPAGIDISESTVWVNNRGDRTMTRIDLLDSTDKTISFAGTPHEFVVVDNRIWVAVITESGVHLEAVDTATSEPTGRRIPLSLGGAGLLRSTPDGALVWLSYEGRVVRIDLDRGKEVAKAEVGGQITSLSLTADHLIVFDRDTRRFLRLDPETGRQAAPPVTATADYRGSVQDDGTIYVGSALVGYGELVGNAVPEQSAMHLKDYSIGIDEGVAWGVNITTSEFRRLTPDLTATIGAPVKELSASDATGYAWSETQLAVLDPSERTVRVFAMTPLRKV